MAAVCRVLRVARSTGYLRQRPRVGRFYRRADDHEVLLSILAVTRSRASYGYRRTQALVNVDRRNRGEPPYNRKRIRRVMRINDLMLPGKKRSRLDRPHTGKVAMPSSNQRWCSDGFNIRCWNADLVRVAFALDCHDRENVGHVGCARDLNGHDIRLLLDRSIWYRFGERTLKTPIEIQWLSDNGGPYVSLETVLYARELGFKPITTPRTALSPTGWQRPSSTRSNGITSVRPTSPTPRRSSASCRDGLTTTTPSPRTRPSDRCRQKPFERSNTEHPREKRMLRVVTYVSSKSGSRPPGNAFSTSQLTGILIGGVRTGSMRQLSDPSKPIAEQQSERRDKCLQHSGAHDPRRNHSAYTRRASRQDAEQVPEGIHRW